MGNDFSNGTEKSEVNNSQSWVGEIVLLGCRVEFSCHHKLWTMFSNYFSICVDKFKLDATGNRVKRNTTRFRDFPKFNFLIHRRSKPIIRGAKERGTSFVPRPLTGRISSWKLPREEGIDIGRSCHKPRPILNSPPETNTMTTAQHLWLVLFPEFPMTLAEPYTTVACRLDNGQTKFERGER